MTEAEKALERLKFTLLAEGYWQDMLKDFAIVAQALGELEHYKAVEKELGIDLITLFKALKNGIYDKEHDRHVSPFLTWHEYFDRMVLFYEEYDDYCYLSNYYNFKDYGKTWALTKEELE